MRIRKSVWIAILVILAVVALAWGLGGFREGFDRNTATPVLPVCPSGSTAKPDGSCRGQCPSGETLDPSGFCKDGSNNPKGFPPKVAPLGCTSGTNSVIVQDQCYFPCQSGYTVQVDSFGVAMCVPTSTPSPVTGTTNPSPSPASSPSTQPMTIGVPSPCRNSYKSIPGGSMEFKCFN